MESKEDILTSSASYEPASPFGDLSEGWGHVLHGWLVLDMAIVLLFALLLGALIAYHPSVRRKMSSLADLEQPKTLLIYSIVAAVVAVLVKAQPQMALVVFGIGGLMRFRTNVGAAKDTGRVILVTVVGLCCGLKIYVVAMLATAIGWLLILILERRIAGEIKIKGIDVNALGRAASAYREILTSAGCEIIRERKGMQKGSVRFVFVAAGDFQRETLETQFQQVPVDIRGVIDWEIS